METASSWQARGGWEGGKGEYLGIMEERKIRFEDYGEELLKWSEANKAPKTYQADERVVRSSLLGIILNSA